MFIVQLCQFGKKKNKLNYYKVCFINELWWSSFVLHVVFRLLTLEYHHSDTQRVRLRSRLILNQDIRTLLSSVRTWIKRWLLTPSTSQMWHQVRERNHAFKRFKAHYLIDMHCMWSKYEHQSFRSHWPTTIIWAINDRLLIKRRSVIPLQETYWYF